MIVVKRAYEAPTKDDGFRVLVDRIWPRGVSKEDADIDLWLKEIAPTSELRKWFNHEAKKWKDFKKVYAKELDGNSETVRELKKVLGEHKKVTLVFAAKDEDHNNAVALKEYLKRWFFYKDIARDNGHLDYSLN